MTIYFPFFILLQMLIDDNDNSGLKRSVSSSMGSSLDDDLKRSDGNSGNSSKSLDIKQEHSGMTNDDDATNPICAQRSKISKIDLVDAESNTVNSGKWEKTNQNIIFYDFLHLTCHADPFVNTHVVYRPSL